jgi:hypothetical protein
MSWSCQYGLGRLGVSRLDKKVKFKTCKDRRPATRSSRSQETHSVPHLLSASRSLFGIFVVECISLKMQEQVVCGETDIDLNVDFTYDCYWMRSCSIYRISLTTVLLKISCSSCLTVQPQRGAKSRIRVPPGRSFW